VSFLFSRTRLIALVALIALALAASIVLMSRSPASATSEARSSQRGGLGQMSGLLPRDKLTLGSAINVNLDKNTVRLPLYPGKGPDGQKVWFVLLDASDEGLAQNHGVNFAPKLANLAIGCPECVQEVELESPTPAQNRFGPASRSSTSARTPASR